MDMCVDRAVSPQDPHVEVLTTSITECGCIWKQSLIEVLKVK